MENRFSNIFFACNALRDYFVSKFWPQHRGAELGVPADIFGNYDVPYVEESWVTRSEQCNGIGAPVSEFFWALLKL